MTNFKDFLNEQLKDKELKAEYNALEPELTIIQAMIDSRKKKCIIQKVLSERTGFAHGNIRNL